ncbi:MAG: hypothetical protein EAZ47_09965 [Bacteroidetes bacterium]|nr:MAG: hypothetical protein EAY72_10680 [Bacteroidota bacterium]TAE62650.1 MAG: hypothetical protein EAY68_08505 [Bacteroidota bacterium]TAF91511.1 MAG: hypothetical protein EAZ47_09965 [Bacteroidota bacterium]
MQDIENPFSHVADDIYHAFSFLTELGFQGKITRNEGWICEVIFESAQFIIYLKFENLAGHFLFSFTNKLTNKNLLMWEYLKSKMNNFNYENYKPDEFGFYLKPLKNIAADFKQEFGKDFEHT